MQRPSSWGRVHVGHTLCTCMYKPHTLYIQVQTTCFVYASTDQTLCPCKYRPHILYLHVQTTHSVLTLKFMNPWLWQMEMNLWYGRTWEWTPASTSSFCKHGQTKQVQETSPHPSTGASLVVEPALTCMALSSSMYKTVAVSGVMVPGITSLQTKDLCMRTCYKNLNNKSASEQYTIWIRQTVLLEDLNPTSWGLPNVVFG